METIERPTLVVHRVEPSPAALPPDVPANTAHFDWDLVTDTWWWSAGMYAAHGYAPHAVEAGFERLLAHQHPMDRERTRDAFVRLLQDGRPFVFEHRLVTGDGVRTTILSAMSHLDTDLRPVRVTGMLLDVHDARRLHHAADQDSIAGLQAEVMRLRTAAESRETVSRATGVLMERHKVIAEDAAALLRRASQVSGRKLLAVASELLYTGKLIGGCPLQRGG